MRQSDHRLRILLLLLSAMAFISFALGGMLYYSVVKNYSEERSHEAAQNFIKGMGNTIDEYLEWSLLSAKSLAGLKEMEQALINPDKGRAEANRILVHFKASLKASECYLIDRSGRAVAASNHDSPESFVGEDYGFRPYVKEALAGRPAVYMAEGITSKKRGIYYSYPVYGKEAEKPLGASVIKVSVEKIEAAVTASNAGIVLLTGPHGMIFISSRPELLFHWLWEAPSRDMAETAETLQFGKGPWPWSGIKQTNNHEAVDDKGKRYQVHLQGLSNYPGWNLIYLHSHDAVLKKVIRPLQQSVGIGVFLACSLFGIIVFSVLKKANTSIVLREQAERALEEEKNKLVEALSQVKELSGLLPICSSCKKIRDDKGYWNQIECYIRDHSEAEFSHGLCPECSDRMYGKEDWYIELKNKGAIE